MNKNDLNPSIIATHHENAIMFLKRFHEQTIDGVFFDPPYSVRQIAECYKSIGLKQEVNSTRSDFYSELKQQIASIVKPKGIVISCGWNSNGIGKTNGFEILEILLVQHGGCHNDTIVVVEQKI